MDVLSIADRMWRSQHQLMLLHYYWKRPNRDAIAQHRRECIRLGNLLAARPAANDATH